MSGNLQNILPAMLYSFRIFVSSLSHSIKKFCIFSWFSAFCFLTFSIVFDKVMCSASSFFLIASGEGGGWDGSLVVMLLGIAPLLSNRIRLLSLFTNEIDLRSRVRKRVFLATIHSCSL